MATTFELISSVTVGSGGAASIDFTSIPSTYTDLCIKASLRDTNAGAHIDGGLKFNDATSNYTWRRLLGNGASASSATGNTDPLIYAWIHNGAGSTSSTFSNIDIYIPNYAGSTNKSVSIDAVDENNGTTAYADLTAGLWANTAAITKISLITTGTLFAQYSTATLYGVKNA
jgi:hypothetical protein